MSLKTIIYSIISVLLFWGFLILALVLFGFNVVLGIIGIVLTLTIPPILMRRALASSKGILDKMIAKFIVPILYLVGLAAILLTYFFAII